MSSYLGSVSNAGDRVTRAIAASAQRTGVDFDYLMGQARIESGLNPNAKAGTSSATGLYQFIDQSWLGVVEKHGSKHGLQWAANAIQRDGRGRYRVDDPQTRQSILALRRNPEIAALMAGEFASDNRQYLESSLGRSAAPVGPGSRAFSGPRRRPPVPRRARCQSRCRRRADVRARRRGQPLDLLRSLGRAAQLCRDPYPLCRQARRGAAAGGSRLPRDGNDLPQVQPADYVRLASARAARPEMTASIGGNDNARLAYMLLAAMGA